MINIYKDVDFIITVFLIKIKLIENQRLTKIIKYYCLYTF